MVLQKAILIQALYIISAFLFICQMTFAKTIAKFQSAALTDAENDKACYNFTVGNPGKNEFFSPNYPNHYPGNIKCTRQIAAEPGHLVKIDFRDQFRLEDSTKCDNDKLEVRDGPYSYSPALGIFCGSTFPNMMTSRDRYLWLQFSSDDSIEYVGFHAVFEFFPVKGGMQKPHIDECSYNRTGASGFIEKVHIEQSRYDYAVKYQMPIDCIWTITTDPGKILYISFKDFKLSIPNDCEKNFVEVFPDLRSSKKPEPFCGTTAEPQKSDTNIARIRLFTHKDAFNGTNFTIHYTAIRELQTKNDQCDPHTEFSCGDQTCVDASLKCDGEPDCKYLYDEDAAICEKNLGAGMGLTSQHMIVILVVFFALVIAMCASISVSCYNKIKERQQREREYKARRSKEASVDATLDRNVRAHSSTDDALKRVQASLERHAAAASSVRDEPDDESSDGCYVPEVDLSVFKHPNGGGNIPKRPVGHQARPAALHHQQQQLQQQFPYISESFESLPEETVVPPAPPPVPMHMKERPQEQPPAPSYRIVGGRVVANPTPADKKPDVPTKPATLERGYGRWPAKAPPEPAEPTTTPAPTDAKASFMRGPLEAGVPKSALSRGPSEIGLPKFGMARVTPDGPRGPLAKGASKEGTPLATFRSPYEDSPYSRGYRPGVGSGNRAFKNPELDTVTPANRFRAQATIEASDKDSSRADSVASTLSAPDVIAKR